MVNNLNELIKYFSIDEKENYISTDEIIGGVFSCYKKYHESDKNIVILVSSTYKANELYGALVNLIPKKDIVLFLENEMIRVEYISESKDILANRIFAMNEMIYGKHKVFILTPSSLYRFYPKKEEFIENIINLKVGETVGINELLKNLQENGYYRVSKIDQSLQFASRGDVVDVFSINYDNPIRIEFFDDEIESIRFFDIATQLSINSVNEINLLPGTTLIFNENEKKNIENKLNFRKDEDLKVLRKDLKEIFISEIDENKEDLLKNNFSSKLYKYYGFLKESKDSILSYLSTYDEIILERDSFEDSKEILFKESHELLSDLFDSGRSLSHLELFNQKQTISTNNVNSITYIDSIVFNKENYKKIPMAKPLFESKRGLEYQKVIDLYLNEFKQIIFISKNKNEFKNITDYLNFCHLSYRILDKITDNFDNGINVLISDFNLSIENKYDDFVIVTSKILFNAKHQSSIYSSKFKEGSVLSSYQELEIGDYVVHENYGIGQYEGVEEIEFSGRKEDYLKIKYNGGDELFLPLYSFNLIRKYAGQEGKIPKLSSLHSDAWKKTKKRIKDKVNDLADKLLVLYQNRALVEGFQFEKDDELQEAFEADFKHQLTEDQERSLKEIKEDMESSYPMDRLLCGDVGFGKTEVAFRAAFKAILSGKQVLLLAPTTLLAKQHYEVALDRFRRFDVNIKLLTRNQTPREVSLILDNVKNGEVNFLIGTHKALGKDVEFKNLGLLIIDEEQRFGVEQKEKIKIKQENLDVLTLSATPIPRTLQSSLVGLKSVSTIQTPPKERLPIQLYVIQKDKKIIKEIIERELARNGQIFYVHNNISDIFELERNLQDLIPELKIGVVHGQMDKNEISAIMASFYLGEIDLLLATSIIENGIDVRNANLIFVDDADRFGLSQLYQIKGRVGRGDRMAYCYLLVERNKKLNDDAKKRLKALQDFTELGSGFKIAQRDLLIRGAGEILGKEQAGFIDDVGIDLYLKLLNEALKSKKDGQIIKEEEPKQNNIIINNAYIPSSFANENEKIEIYQRISEANTFEKIDGVKNHIKDVFGEKVPESLLNVLRQREIDIYLNYPEFNGVNSLKDTLTLILSEEFSNKDEMGTILFTKLINYIKKIKMTYHNKKIEVIFNKTGDYEKTIVEILKIIHEEAIKYETR